jgi:3,5-epimerase/4-reductase
MLTRAFWAVPRQNILLFGKGGWICGILADLLTKQGKTFRIADSRMENREQVARYGVDIHYGGLALMLFSTNARNGSPCTNRHLCWFSELDEVKPTHVLNAAGVTGRPNVDWCEDHKEETIRANVIGALNLVLLCFTLL